MSFNNLVCHRLCVFSAEDTKWKPFVSKLLIFIIIVANIIVYASSIAYIVKFVSYDVSESLYAVFQISGALSVTFTIVVVLFLKENFNGIYNDLSNIYATYENEDAYRFLAQVSNKSELIWRKIVLFIMVGFIIHNVTVSLIVLLMGWLMNGNVDWTQAYRSYKFILPWDQQTLIGYIAEKVFEIAVSEIYFILNCALLLLFVSICWHHQAFYKFFAHSVRKLSDPNVNHVDKEYFSQLIRFQVMARDLFMVSKPVYNCIIATQLITSILLVACVIFQLDLRVRDIDLNIMLMLLAATVGVSNLFAYCYFAKLATDSFIRMSDCLYDSNWPNLTIEFQKYVIVMIQNSQRPLYYHGLGNAKISLETFTKCLKTCITYYMMFKTLTSE